jgi:hypothetical protein
MRGASVGDRGRMSGWHTAREVRWDGGGHVAAGKSCVHGTDMWCCGQVGGMKIAFV